MSKYNAFISYTHASEMPLANALDKALTRFAKPWNRLRAMRIYRDIESQPLTPNLLNAVERAMDDSEFLILLASPRSAASPWVPREVAHWVKHRSVDKLLIVVCDGEIEWDHEAGDFDWDRTDCLPDTLRGVYQGAPLYLDMRWSRGEEGLTLDHPQFKDNVARIAATVNGKSKEDMLSEEVTQFRRTARIRNAAIATLSVLLVATAVAATVAIHQRNQAIKRSLQIQVQSALDNNRLGRAVQIARAARERFGDGPMIRDMGWRLVSHPSAIVNEFNGLGDHFARFSPGGTRLMTGVYKGEGLRDVRIQDRLGGNEKAFDDIGAVHFLPGSRNLLLLDPSQPESIEVSAEMRDGDVVTTSCMVPGARVYNTDTDATAEYEGEWFGERVQKCGGLIRIFDEEGQHLWDVPAPNGTHSVAASPDGRRIAAASSASGVIVMDESGNVSAILPGGEMPGVAPVVSPDGSLVAIVTVEAGRPDRMAATNNLHCTLETTVLDFEGPFGEAPPGQVLEETCEPAELLEKLAIRGYTRVFTASGDEVVRLPGTHPVFAFGGIVTLKDVEVFDDWQKHPHWYALDPDAARRHEIELKGFEVVVSPDGNWLASGGRYRQETWIWHRSGRFHARVDGGTPAWVPGQPMLVTNLWGNARIWDLERLRFGSRAVVANVIGVPETDLGVPPEVMAFDDEQAFWRGCHPDCGPDFSYIDAIDEIETAQQQDPGCDAQAAHYRGNLMLSVCAANGTWRMYDLESLEVGPIASGNHGPGLEKVGFSPDGKTVISIDGSGLARLWDVSSGTADTSPVSLYLGEEVYAYAFSPDSRMVAMAPNRGTARLWNTDGVLLASLQLRNSREEFKGMRFFNDGKHLVFAGTDSGYVDFYRLWTTNVGAFYEEFGWVPGISTDELTQ